MLDLLTKSGHGVLLRESEETDEFGMFDSVVSAALILQNVTQLIAIAQTLAT